jgi:hypothetical protein
MHSDLATGFSARRLGLSPMEVCKRIVVDKTGTGSGFSLSTSAFACNSTMSKVKIYHPKNNNNKKENPRFHIMSHTVKRIIQLNSNLDISFSTSGRMM